MMSNPTPKNLTINASPRDIAYGNFLLEKITPWAQNLREKLFGQKEAPFYEENSWVDWIKEQSTFPKHDVEVFQLMQELCVKTGLDCKASTPSLPYAITDNEGHWRKWQEVDPVPYGSKTHELSQETESMAKATGFRQVQLVMYILTGSRPLFERCTVSILPSWKKLSDNDSLSTVYTSINIYASDFTAKELQIIYNNVRTRLTAKAGNIENPKHAMVYNLVKEAGGPWNGKGSLAKWETIRQRVNVHWPQKQFKTERGVRNTFKHYEKEIEKAFQATQQGQQGTEAFIRALRNRSEDDK